MEKEMNVLLLGNGGREHALAWKMAQSKRLGRLYVAPGNAGTAEIAENVEIGQNDFPALADFIRRREIGMLVVGPEEPLVLGVREYMEGQAGLEGLLIVGPGRDGALLEGSKDFAKEFMVRHGIPTAQYRSVTRENLAEGIDFLRSLAPPYVLKADGLAAGKGVLIIDDLEEAEAELGNMLAGKFGEASAKVVIEEYLHGIEISVFAITDGKGYKILGSAKDYKRIGEGDAGLNTGGMGAVSPVPFADEVFNRKVEERIVRPTIEGFKEEGIDYRGFVFFGLMNVGGDPKVIEYNVRMGDPETEVVIPRLKTDILALFAAAANGRGLLEVEVGIDERYCVTVMLVSAGYPGAYEKGKKIAVGCMEGSMVFHSGTGRSGDRVVTNGGRVMTVSSFGGSIGEALALSYDNIGKIDFEGKYFRWDIGKDLMK